MKYRITNKPIHNHKSLFISQSAWSSFHKDYLYLLSEINNGISIPERIKNFIDNYSYEVSEGGLSLIPEDEVDLEKRFGKYLREDVKYEE